MKNLETIQNVDEVVVEVFGRENRKSGFGQLLFGRDDDRPETVELGLVGQEVLEVGEGQGSVKAVPVGSSPANVAELRAQALHFFQVNRVTRELLKKKQTCLKVKERK